MKGMTGIIIGVSVACVLLITAAVYFSINNKSAGPRTVELAPAYTERVDKGYWHTGAASPKVTLLEYLDLQCPACQAMNPVVQEVMKQTSDFVQLQVRIYPLPQHDKAILAAHVAEAAGRQGKFFEMKDILYTTQPTWTLQTPLQFKTAAEGYAQSLNLNMDQYRADVDDSSIQDPIDRDKVAANAIPLEGTPTFVVNGQAIPVKNTPSNADDFVKILKAAAGIQ